MTYQEALNYLNNAQVDMKSIESMCEASDLIETCKKAIEKQIPKKPLQDRIGDSYHTFPICPTCKCGLDEVTDEHHCSCGQAIDWSDI